MPRDRLDELALDRVIADRARHYRAAVERLAEAQSLDLLGFGMLAREARDAVRRALDAIDGAMRPCDVGDPNPPTLDAHAEPVS